MSSAMSPFDRARTTSYLTLKTVRFRDIASCLSKVADFNPRHLHLASPPYGLIPVEFRGDLWQEKTRVSVLSCDVA